jgi:hypothetical protein
MNVSSGATARRRVHRRLVLIASLAISAATVAWSVSPVAAVTPTPFNTNLVKNPGFEAGAASPNGYTAVTVPNWTTPQLGTVVAYGTAGGFPTKAESNRINGGKKFFASGPHGPTLCGWAEQTIPVVGRNTRIDSGHLKITVRGLLGTYDSQTDTASVQTFFLDNGGQAISELEFHRSKTNGKLQPGFISVVVPEATRSILIRLWADNTEGYCDAYFDKISVKLSKI